MFTGLVQSLGQLQPLGPNQLKITCLTPQDPILQGIALGDSIAVDGVCLTVEKILPQGFIAAASPETLAVSTLGKVLENDRVNLEASLRVGSKIGGHFVTGHVDGIGQLEQARQTANAWEMSFSAIAPPVARYIVRKGSIAINGISLTVADCSARGDRFSVAVIPVTYRETNLQYLKPGDWVNLEGDILGKYVEKFTGSAGGTPSPQLAAHLDLDRDDYGKSAEQAEEISPDFLAEHGYLS